MRIFLAIVLILGVSCIVIFSDQVFGASSIPSWIRNTAKWWSEGQVSDSEFLDAIKYLIDQKIITIQSNGPGTDSIMSPLVTTDKRAYQVGDQIKISGSGFDNGTIGLLVGDDRFGVFLDKSPNVFAGSQISELGNMIKYPIPDPTLRAGQWKKMDFSAYGSILKSNAESDSQGTWEITLKNSNLTAGHYEIRAGQKVYGGYDVLSNSSQTFLLKVAKTDFVIQ